LMYP